MSFERYKTQVLLLHSEQSTLDVLTTAFNDKYSVHCETSGTDALNTLGDTPIHVILSAHDLPGMSGLDALREAQKRSPDTVGVLIAGPDKNDGLDARMRAKDNFQIFRGKLTAKTALELVEAAMNRNDTPIFEEAPSDFPEDFDDMEPEHIVIETSENGSTIISDGTGQMPMLDPEKISANIKNSRGAIDILVLSRDEEFLATAKDASRGLHRVHHAETAQQAEDIARKTPIGVLITDAGIAGENIETLTQKLRSHQPRMVAIVAGRREDGETLMDLINRGHVYRFLLKPVSPGRTRLAIEASVRHHQDAPDSAFRTKSSPAPEAPASSRKASPPAKPAPETKAREAARPVAKPAAKPVTKPAAQDSQKNAQDKQENQGRKDQKKPAARKISPTISDAPLEQDMDNVFDVESSFVETMTDIAVSIGKKVGGTRGKPESARADDSKAKKPAAQEPAASGPQSIAVDPQKPPSRTPKTLAMAGGAMGIAAAIAWLFVGGQAADVADDIAAEAPRVPQQATAANEPPPAPAAAPVVAAAEAPVEPMPDPVATESPPQPGGASVTVYQVLLDAARSARDAGNLIRPADSNAVALYLVALEATPGDATLKSELNLVIGQVLSMAETAILEQSAERANEALAAARMADPANPRIALLDAQVMQIGLRAKLEEARLAIGEQRFDDAELRLAEARGMAGGESVDVNLVSLELATARNQAQVAAIIAVANERAAAGLLLSPPDDSARYHYELALTRDPGNQAALQGLTDVAGKLVGQARQAIDLARFDEADKLLRDAAAINPSSSELSDGYAALAAAREAVLEAERQAEAARVAELERQAELARQAEAERLAELERQAELARQAEAERLAELERQAEAERQAELARQEELRRQAELERQAEAERLAELEREAERARQAEVERQAQLARLAELERQAEVERQAELKRQEELARQAELARLAELERQAEQERLAEIARREEEARLAEQREAERQAVEKNAAATAASSALGVAAAKVRSAPRPAAPAPQRPSGTVTAAAPETGSAAPAQQAPARQAEIEGNQALLADSSAPLVVATDVAPAVALGSGTRQAQVSAGLPQFAGPSIGSFAREGADPAADELVPISTLTRTNYVPPVYPRSAQRRNISGAVEVTFTVDPSGAVTDILVVESNPGDTFSQAAMDAVQQWRFEPVVVDGRPVEKRTAVRLAFDLE